MIILEEQTGLNGFFKKLNFRNFAKAAFAPHLLIPKNKRGMLIKGALAPHTLIKKNQRGKILKGIFAPHTLLKR